jgi:thiamine pyrophosphokinase
VIIGDLDSITPATRRFFAGGKGLEPLSVGERVASPNPRPPAYTAFSAGKKGRGYVQIIQIKRQDNTDLEKALDYLRTQKFEEVTIIGATGRRIDFTLGNLSVTWNYTSSMKLTFVGDDWKAMPVESGKKIAAKSGTTISLVPFGSCSGITLKGLRYPLTNATMRVGEIGVSNVVRRSPFSVIVRKGKMLLFIMGRT